MMSSNLPKFALFEDTLEKGESYYFFDPVEEIVAYDERSLEHAFEEISKFKSQGFYLTGYISYEASYYLDSKLYDLRSKSDGKLLHFVVFRSFSNTIPELSNSNNFINLMMDNFDFSEYSDSFIKIQEALISGESYQINFTKNIQAQTPLNSEELYYKLKKQQPVEYAAYLPFLDPDIISISPELFFRKNGEKLIVKPMKGTAKLVGNHYEDTLTYNQLLSCDKNKSENLIIVDLLRNDLSGISENHTVKVDELFTIEKYNDLLQMTSEISAKVNVEISFKKILASLFPCGSITGAPKKRTIELIRHLEKNNRGVYTGSVGYILPNNDMCFNVAIRTIQKVKSNLQIGVGGGITVYSESRSEWDEMKAKINFIRKIYKPDFCLIESFYFFKRFKKLDLHLKRLELTAARFFFEIDIENIKDEIEKYCIKLNPKHEYKIRLEYKYDKSFLIEHSEVDTIKKTPIELTICPHKVTQNSLFRYKTNHHSTRGFYTDMHNKYLSNSKDSELVYLNQNNNITETRFHNIVISKNGKMYTPKLSDGVLDGIERKSLINSGELISKSIDIEEFENAEEIYLINSVRGFTPAYFRK